MSQHPSFVPACGGWCLGRKSASMPPPESCLADHRTGIARPPAQNGKRRRKQRKDDIAVSLLILLT